VLAGNKKVIILKKNPEVLANTLKSQSISFHRSIQAISPYILGLELMRLPSLVPHPNHQFDEQSLKASNVLKPDEPDRLKPTKAVIRASGIQPTLSLSAQLDLQITKSRHGDGWSCSQQTCCGNRDQ
jgi:hypothetical protein